MVLGATDVDISGGDALPEKTDHFENPFSDLTGSSYPHIHWGRDITTAGRIVITSDAFGWRGDTYSLYVLQGDVTPEQFRADLVDTNPQHRYSPLLDRRWRTPLVFWSNTIEKPWFIVVDEPYETTGQWEVYVADRDGFKSACKIKFWPAMSRAAAPAILPKEVREFANLLDQTLGDGPEQGTLQSTARLRLYSRHIWINVAYRPWALSDKETYNRLMMGCCSGRTRDLPTRACMPKFNVRILVPSQRCPITTDPNSNYRIRRQNKLHTGF
jgi:hypothetical protein